MTEMTPEERAEDDRLWEEHEARMASARYGWCHTCQLVHALPEGALEDQWAVVCACGELAVGIFPLFEDEWPCVAKHVGQRVYPDSEHCGCSV